MKSVALRGSSVVPVVAREPAKDAGTKLQRAKFVLHHAGKDGTGTDGELGELEFQFNPKELTISKKGSWKSEPHRAAEKAPTAQFTGAEPGSLSLELLFDASRTHDGSVVAKVEQLFSACVPTERSRSMNKPSPPLVVLQWGSTQSFPAYVASVTVKYTLFAPDGTPLRARCSVQLQEVPETLPAQNPTSGALATRRSRVVVAGDSLASVAHQEYGDPALWRVLADANGIDDPLRLRPGTTLLLPGTDDMVPAGR